MNSPHQREQLPDLLSDALDANERARVESHLRECAQCARELRELKQIQAAVAALPAAPVPVSVRANVRAQLRERPPRAFVLPFAFPLKTSQLAWGGAAVVGAIGLMLLGRPSLQNDVYSPSAPVSETEMAAGAAKHDGSAQSAKPDSAIQDKATGPKAPQPRASDGAPPPKTAPQKPAPVQSAPGVDVNGQAPKAMAPLPSLPAPSISTKPRADANGGAQPSFAFPVAPAPLSPPQINKSKSRAVAPGDFEPEPKAKFERENNGRSKAKFGSTKPSDGATKNDSPAQNAPGKVEKPAPKSAEDNSFSQENSVSRATIPAAPIVPPMAAPAPSTSFANGAASSARNDAAFQAPKAVKPNRAMGRIAPSAAQTDRASETAGAADMTLAASATSAQWPGGAVKATLSPRAQTQRGDNQRSSAGGNFALAPPSKFPLILTFGVAQPIGKARLILLTPGGEQTIWRGELNALPAQVELSQTTIEKANGKSGQTLHARLEQIGGDDNPISSSTFELPVP